ncbi:MAG: methyltransferase domain-containing protein [Pseudolysinimonas sp.]
MPRDDATARQRRVWQKAAPTYDRKIAGVERGLAAGGREWIGERATGRVLEVAIGTGRSLPFYGADVELTGVDLTPEMLELARRRAAQLGLTPELVLGDAEHLPFDDASFDTVVCELGLCSIPHPAAAIAEMKRVLRPGGTLLLLDHIGSSWAPVWALQWLMERVTILTSGEHFTRRQLPLVRSAGFEIVETERLKAGTIERIRAKKQ